MHRGLNISALRAVTKVFALSIVLTKMMAWLKGKLSRRKINLYTFFSSKT